MRSLFGASPARLKNSNSRDSTDATRAPKGSRRGGYDEAAETKRRSFAFMKYSPDRRSSASMRATREHSKQIAMQLSKNEPVAAPRSSTTRKKVTRSAAASFQPTFPDPEPAPFQPTFPEPAAFDDFNPFGHDMATSNNSFSAHERTSAPSSTSFSAHSRSSAPLNSFTGHSRNDPFAAPQEDFFAQAPAPAPLKQSNYQQRRSTSTASTISNRSAASSAVPTRDNSFDESVASSGAYDMDLLPFQASQRDPMQRKSSNRGRPPRNRTTSEASFGSSTSSLNWPQQQAPPPQAYQSQSQQAPPLKTVGSSSSHSKSMTTFPSNSSMQSAFAGQQQQMATPPPKSMKAVNMTPPTSAGGAAARRRMRSHLRHGSSGNSLNGSECASFDGTPPASPSSGRHRQVISSNGSVGSNNGAISRNRVANYTIGGGNWQNSPSPSFRGGASVCSSAAESDIDLFESQNENGGFTFDAFGLDASEIDREVQEAMRAIEGGSDFGGFTTNTATTTSTNTASKLQDTSMDDFAPQAWDSPPGSRRSTPTPREQQEQDDGFVDGFRVSKPSPLPLISVNRESPVSSERSSSLSSITDHNADHGGPRRNVFKEKAGFTSSNRGAVPSPAQPKKQWVPPPGAVRMLTPPRNQVPQLRPTQQTQTQPQPQPSAEGDAKNYWKANFDKAHTQAFSSQTTSTTEPQKQPPTTGLAAKKWQSAAAKFSAPKSQPSEPAKIFGRKQTEEEKKDDDSSVDRDNHTDTTSGMTTVVSESQPDSPRHSQQQKQEPAFVRGNLQKLETGHPIQDSKMQEGQGKKLSPQEQRRRELELLRNGNSGFKSPGALRPVHGDHLKPQQERANECRDQRSSFGSLRERLKSAVDNEQSNKAQLGVNPMSSPRPGTHSPPNSTSSKSEVGVSSFTRQKMKIANMSTSSKSEVNVSKSPQQSEVSAVLNRVRGMSGMNALTSPKTATSTPSSQPAFAGVKLRKSPVTVRDEDTKQQDLQPWQIAQQQRQEQKLQEQEQQLRQHQLEEQSHQEQAPEVPPTHPGPPSPRRMSYTKRRELELRKIAERGQAPPKGSPMHLLQQTYSPKAVKLTLSQSLSQNLSQSFSQDHGQPQREPSQQQQVGDQEPHEQEPPARKMSYRERRELELAKEREAKGLEQEPKEPPTRDVADLIRRRIAANKSKSCSPSNEESQQPSQPMGRDRLRPSRRPVDDSPSPVEFDHNSAGAPANERDSYHNHQQRGFHPSEVHDQHSFPGQAEQTVPLHGGQPQFPQPEAVSSCHPIVPPRHSQPQPAHQTETANSFHHQEQQSTAPKTASAGGLSALHAQLKQMSKARAEEQAEEQTPHRPKPPVSAGGLSALHAQLKQLKAAEPEEEEAVNNELSNGPAVTNEPKTAPRRIQAVMEGKSNFEKLEVNTAGSQASDQNSSPSRTPKATYAMLNAFLHGRDTVASEDALEAPKDEEQEEDLPQPPGSPPKVSQPPAPSSSIADGRPALKNDPTYARYFTMLKIGMPMDVVKHAMIRDNLDPAVMDGDHNKPACLGIPLKDDPKFSKYFKMLKIGMPMEAVKHAMERDGFDSHIMDQDHNLPAGNSNAKQEEAPKEKDSHRRARLHWKPLREIRRNSMWAKIDEDPSLCNLEIDEDEFAELFQAELQPDAQKAKKRKVKSPRKGAAVRVIDPKRANNGGIILARLKMSHDDMADVVDRIDENCMTAEQIEHIIEYLPTKEERRALESYMLEGGQDAAEKFDGLCECEKFMVSMMTVKHAKRKVRALLFKLQFESCLEALYQETHIVDSACDELSNSVRLRQLLGIVLTFGNRLNTAGKGKKKKAGAFTLDSLLKLNQAKAFDKKTTFLQYIVLIVQRNNELLLNFKDDLPTSFKADKVFWDQCISDLEEVENQLENVRRIALYQAKQAAKFRRKKKKQQNGEDDEESLTDLSLSLEEEVESLRATPIGMFTLSAIKKVSFLRDRVEGTKVKFNKLLEYFGEDDKHMMQPHELFTTIVKFCRDFEKAKEQVMEEEKKKKREERKRQSVKPQPAPTAPNQAPSARKPHTGMLLKASAMQPNASRLIQDMKRGNAAAPIPATPPDQQVTPQTRNPAPQRRSEMSSSDHASQQQSHQLSPMQPQQIHEHARSPHARQQTQPHTMHEHARSQRERQQQVQLQQQMQPQQPMHHTPRSPHEEYHTQPHHMHDTARSSRGQQQGSEPAVQQSHLQKSYGAPTDNYPVVTRSPNRGESQGNPHLHGKASAEQHMDVRMQDMETPPSRGRESSRGRASSHRERPSHRHSGAASHSLEREVFPPGMQDQGRLEVSYGTTHQMRNPHEIAPSGSTESQTSTLRNKARMQGRSRPTGSPPEDPPAFTASTRAHEMHRQSSAPVVGSPPAADHGISRRSSLPVESPNAASNTSSNYSNTQNMMRNKLRSKRMMERKARHIGQSSPTPNA